MRHLLLFILVIFSIVALNAQKYGNEWINFSQTYHKIAIAKAGVYRIDSLTLSQYYDLSSVDPKNFQVIVKGKEQYVYIKGESDGVFNNGDYLEFYAEPFMGDLDSCVYSDIKYSPNPFLSLYSDTLYAFLSLNSSFNNKRYVLETDTNSAAYAQADHFYAEKISTQNVQYNDVAEYSSYGVSDPHLTQAEGKGFPINKGTSYSYPITAFNTYTSVPKSFFIRLNYSGASIDNTYSPDHQIQTYYTDQNNALVLLKDTSFNGYSPIQQSFTLNAQNLSNNIGITLSSINNPNFVNSNLTNWHYVYYFYPHDLNLNNQSLIKLWVDNSGSSTKNFYNFSSFGFGSSSNVLLYDLSNGRRISTVINGTKVRAVIPDAAGGRKLCVMVPENDTIVVKKLVKVNGTGSFRNYGTTNAANPYVIISHKRLQSSSADYKAYRESQQGGSFNVIDADIEFLYEQFSYGVRNHPLAIRHFLKFLNDTLSIKPRYVFLIGKALSYDNALPGSFPDQNLIPTIGVPGSDNLLTAQLSGTSGLSYYPEIPIGRLAAITNSEVSNYLNKVKEKESAPKADWQKRVLHFIGGDDENLSNTLSSYMNVYKDIITDTLFGAEVLSFKKTSTAPIQINISDSIRSVINNGAAMINIFGHGSSNGFDQAIDDPNLYQNAGRYPFFIANSCYSGDIHQYNIRSVSENFVIAKQKGSVGFLATTSYGFDYSLNNFTNAFYRALSQTHYNSGVGDMVKESAFQNNNNGDILTKITALDMTLCGDPAIRVSNGLLPDYQIYDNNVSFDLKKYTDSVGIVMRYKNTDKAIRDTILLKIDRFFPNGDTTVLLKKIKAPMFMDSSKVFLAIDFSRGIGLNKIRVELDYRNKVNEANESNNMTSFIDLFIPGGDIAPVYPYKYAVIPKTSTLTLKASTTDPFAPTTTYRFELDTSDTFKSLLSTTLITSTGGVIEWKVNLPYADSTVYYWRVSRDSISPDKTFAWRETSFQTIGNKSGWGQAHFHQFKNDHYRFVNYRRDLRKFVFQNSVHSIKCRTGVHPYTDLSTFNYFFDTQLKEGWSSGFNGWNFAVFDSISGQPQMTKSLTFPNSGVGPYNNCVEYGYRYVYTFGEVTPACGTNPNWKTDMENFLNAIPANQYVLGYTTGLYGNYAHLSSYSNSLYTAFDNIGAKNIRTTSDTVPYILFGRKGMSAGQAHTSIGTNKRITLNQEDSIRSKWKDGFIESEIIGPSNGWQSVHWQMQSIEATPGDTSILKVIGIRKNGQQDTLGTFVQDSTDVLDLYHYADAKTYPFLKLVAFMYDNVHRTSPQLKRWQVMYDEAPECAINPLKGFASINDTLQEGDQVTFRFPIENIGMKDFKDSLVVTYWVENNDRLKIDLPHSLKVPPFKPGDLIVDTVKLNTYQFKGSNVLWIQVNPIQHSRYQLEQESFNNIGRYPFNVYQDVTNPLLDVTFDGVRILNGDLVSSKPNILVTLKDENKFLALNDTGAFTIRLTKPDQTQERIYFGQQLEFTPAKLPKNSCSINYRPAFAVDGKYALTVQASDRTNNASAARAYHIEFEVMTKPSITQILNYPNPFTTSTRFVFTLTGNEIPEVFTIQIMTVTGKLVREITRAELGNIHIGRNITEYAWDGRDTYGDRLANGVYLYRVLTKLNGENIERKASGADNYFTKEFGKMVLMR